MYILLIFTHLKDERKLRIVPIKTKVLLYILLIKVGVRNILGILKISHNNMTDWEMICEYSKFDLPIF